MNRKQHQYLLSLNISAAARQRKADEMELETKYMRRESADRIIARLEEIIEAVNAAVDDEGCRLLGLHINGRGDLVIGRQKDVNELLSTVEGPSVPLSEQPADEVRFVEATANYFRGTV